MKNLHIYQYDIEKLRFAEDIIWIACNGEDSKYLKNKNWKTYYGNVAKKSIAV